MTAIAKSAKSHPVAKQERKAFKNLIREFDTLQDIIEQKVSLKFQND